MLQDLSLDVILRILSSLERRDLYNIGRCSRLLRLLANQSLMTRNIVICAQSQHERWLNDSCFFNMSQVNLEPVRHAANDNQEEYLMEIYSEPYSSASEETLTYVNILQRFHCEEKGVQVDEQMMVIPLTSDNMLKSAPSTNSLRAVSPTFSDYSKSSAASLFSDGPPILSNSEWNSPIQELDHFSNHSGSGGSDCESSSSTDSLAKLRSSTKVKDKAALFEKLIMKDSRRARESQKKPSKKKSYGALSNLFEENTLDILASKRKISQDYIEELARCNGDPGSTLRYQIHPQEDIRSPKKSAREKCEGVECSLGEQSRRHQKHKMRRVHRNRLIACVTQGNKVLYEKI
ncbi:MFB1 (YDR219C) [Zygosaccharomyces parabailii]|nr:MFB1 (YDR219C) [Zygosaccharomyces parabailii]CDH09905.1 uncharacterized protein ZBAI_01689 [Zygosaccharomyces bailii ISA1307]